VTTLEIQDSEAHLWIVRPDEVRDEELLRRYRGLLSEDERQKCARFRFEEHQHACLVTRALLRTVLSRYAGVDPEDWRFVTNEWGRPEIDEPREARWLRFNLSHTKGLVVCLAARGREVGVDVEDRTRKGELLNVAERFFSPFEAEALRALPGEQQLDRFFFYWTLKESYIKARGMGLAIPLDQFSFDLDTAAESGIRVLFDPKLGDNPARWEFSAMSYGRRYAVASSIERRGEEELRLVLRETVPLA
jgi:4'-phosphopantetheinyl transferase